MLPRSTIITVKVRRNASSGDVYRMVSQAAGIRPENQEFFSLYEIVEHTFGELKLYSVQSSVLLPSSLLLQKSTSGLVSRVIMMQNDIRTLSERKVQPNEYPHSLYIANYSTAAATCLVVKRWLFDLETEESIYRDPVALDFIFQEVTGV